ncbi:hypothetical protein [Candidatus Protochlamydia phocaeensis]|uniref:hypothetical protein n=1 Tax=Candidatus Protochlamydia phocaeensis TaxID=1414722 RepID=UPI0008387D69|nr:hypothetical protein [Candidatus Protochlamydia phocaeensis]
MKKRLVYFLFSLLFILNLNGIDINKILESISEEDKGYISSFFSTLISDQFAYTLFADKPISLSAHFNVTP